MGEECHLRQQKRACAPEESHRFFLQANDPDVNVQKQAVPTYWAASAKGRELIDLQRDFFNRTGIEHQALGLFVFDATLNKFRPIGKIAGGGDPIPPEWYPGWKPGYFPRMIAKGDMEIIRDPKGNPRAYEALKDEIEAMGFLRDSIDHHIANIARESANNEFFASVDSARTAKLPQTTIRLQLRDHPALHLSPCREGRADQELRTEEGALRTGEPGSLRASIMRSLAINTPGTTSTMCASRCSMSI